MCNSVHRCTGVQLKSEPKRMASLAALHFLLQYYMRYQLNSLYNDCVWQPLVGPFEGNGVVKFPRQSTPLVHADCT